MMVQRSKPQVRCGGGLHLRLFDECMSLRLDCRAFVVASLLTLTIGAIGMILLVNGTYATSPTDVLSALLGQHRHDMVRMIVVEWRLPRVGLALLLGAALGVSGAIFQSLTRNPLGSPDIIGFSAGSYTGALIAIILLSGGYYETAAGSMIGGVTTAGAVYVLAWRKGVQGFRLIVVGIGVAAMLSAFNTWMIREADLNVAMSAAIWGAGSLNGLGLEQLVPIAIVLLFLMPASCFMVRSLRQLEMGDDMARASGVETNRARLFLILIGVALTATVTAAAGPISFIALVAPQIARRLVHSSSPALMSSALMGGVLLLMADWAAQHALSVQLPVGIMTVSIGGFYFLWLLARESRK